jgi:hypothetical protein
METSFILDLYDGNEKPVQLEVFLKFHEEEAPCVHWETRVYTSRPLYSSEIINMKATQNGAPYTITDEDSEDWDSEINAACERELELWVDSRRSIA